jgi:shikimate kinase
MMISLTGFMGCGKSSVGRELSRLLCCPFMDLDSVIEERAGRRIPEIFSSDGEEAFRRMERDAVIEILEIQKPHEEIKEYFNSTVLALGGGTVMTPECAEIVHEKTLCIYLRASVDTLLRNLADEAAGRPMLQGDLQARIEELMALRSATYENTAHIIIDTDGKSAAEIASEIFDSLN